MKLGDLVRPLERWAALDSAADWLGSTAGSVLGSGSVKSVLSGTWLGHPLHPALTDLPIGFLTAATVADLFGGEGGASAADALTAVGLVTVAPTAAAGISDWVDTVGAERRVGFIHALANVGASTLFLAALLSRRGGNRAASRLFSVAGLGVLNASGYLGGHLVFTAGIGVDHTVFDEPPLEWTKVARESDLADDTAQLMWAQGYGVMLYRHAGTIHAMADRCSHAAGPLHEGEVGQDLCVTCPWHGSRFRLSDGSVMRGPATAGQPVFDARVRDGNVEVRRRQE